MVANRQKKLPKWQTEQMRYNAIKVSEALNSQLATANKIMELPPSQVKPTQVSSRQKEIEKNTSKFLDDKIVEHQGKILNAKTVPIIIHPEVKYLCGITVQNEPEFEKIKTGGKYQSKSRYNDFMEEWNCQRDHKDKDYNSWEKKGKYKSINPNSVSMTAKPLPMVKYSNKVLSLVEAEKLQKSRNTSQIDLVERKIAEGKIEKKNVHELK